jgi:hypothetical protein
MPENSQQRISGRPPVAVGGSAPAKLEVVARATDPMVNQGLEGQDVIKALASINPAINNVGNALATGNAINKQDNRFQAMVDFAMPNEDSYNKPSGFFNNGEGYDETWDLLAAQKYAHEDYQPAVQQFYVDNGHLPPQEFAAKLRTDITEPFTAGILQGDSPHQVAGFLPEVQSMNQTVIQANQAKYQADKLIEKNSLISSSIRNNITTGIQVELGVNDPSQFLDPKWYAQFQKDKSDPFKGTGGKPPAELLSLKLHQMYVAGRAEAKTLGKTTAEYSSEYLDEVSKIATRYGMPELLQYALIPDKDNITVSDANGQKVEKDIMEATAVQHRLNTAIEKQNHEAKVANQRSVTRIANDAIFDLSQSNDPQRLQKILQIQDGYRQNAEKYDIPPEESKYVNSVVKAVTERGSFAASSDDTTIVSLYSKGMKLSHSDVLRSKDKLEEKDFTKLMDRAWQYEKASLDRSHQDSQYMQHKALDEQQKEIEDFYTIRNPITGVIDPESLDTKGKVSGMIGRWYQRNPKADAAALHQYWQSDIMKKITQPNNPYRQTTATPAAPQSAPPKASAKVPMKTSSGVEFHIDK